MMPIPANLFEMAEELRKYGYIVEDADNYNENDKWFHKSFNDDDSRNLSENSDNRKRKALIQSNRRLTLCTQSLWK